MLINHNLWCSFTAIETSCRNEKFICCLTVPHFREKYFNLILLIPRSHLPWVKLDVHWHHHPKRLMRRRAVSQFSQIHQPAVTGESVVTDVAINKDTNLIVSVGSFWFHPPEVNLLFSMASLLSWMTQSIRSEKIYFKLDILYSSLWVLKFHDGLGAGVAELRRFQIESLK